MSSAFAACVVATNTSIHAATQGWDADGVDAPTTVGGSGNWLGGNTWFDTTTNAYSAWVNANLAVLGGAAGTVTVNGTVSAADVQLNAAYTLDVSGGNLTMTSLSGTNIATSTLTNTGGTRRSVIFNNTAATSYTGLITGNLDVTKQSAGNFTLAGGNTYVGNTTFSGGSTSLSGANAVGNGTSGLTMNAATLDLGGFSHSVGAVSIAGTGAVTISNGNLIGTSYTATNTAGTATVSAVLEGTAVALSKSGAGVLSLSGNNTYTGNSTVSAGTLIFSGSANAAPGIYLANGGILQFAKTGSLYNGLEGSWSASNLKIASGASLALNVGGTDQFTTGNVTTVLTNLGGLGGAVATGEGLQAGSAIAFDTTNAAGGTFTLADNVSDSTGAGGGAIGLGKLGAGTTLVLSGTKSYTGTTTVYAGTLTVSGGATLGASTAALTMIGGTLDLATTSQTVGAVSLNGGNLTNGNLTGTAYSSSHTAGTATVSASAVLQGASIALSKSGAGILTLAGNNTYGGGTTLTGGEINANNNGALGSGVVGMSSAGAPRLIVANGVAIPNNITIGTTTGVNGRNLIEAATNSGAISTVNGTINITGALTSGGHFGMNGLVVAPTTTPILILNGAISSSVTVFQRNAIVVYGGGGTGYSTLQVNEGTARVKNTNGISTAATVNLNSNTTSGTLDLAGNNQSLVAVNRRLSNTATVNNSVASTTATLTLTGTNLTTNNTGTTPVPFNSFIIANGAGTTALTVDAPGNVVSLAGANTYTGNTTVTSGTLVVTGSLAAGSAVSVSAGGTLGGTGTAAGPVTALGTIAPGVNGAGTLTTGAADLTSGTLAIEINGAAGDKLLSTGAITLGGPLNVSLLGGGFTQPSYVIAEGASLTGTFSSVTSGYSVTYNGTQAILVQGSSNTYADWLAANAPATGFETDSDNDGISNGLENVFGTNPNTFNTGLTQVSATATSVTYKHPLNPTVASDVTYSYQWSTDLVEWKASGVSNTGGTNATIVASAPVSGVVTVTTTATAGPSAKLFTRIAAVK